MSNELKILQDILDLKKSTQVELGKKAGVKQSQISEWKSGLFAIKWKMLVHLAKVQGYEIIWKFKKLKKDKKQ